MRKKLLMLASSFVATLLLTGCVTPALYDSTTMQHKELASDELIAFAEVQKENLPLKKGSLIMQGKESWFVIDPSISRNQEELVILRKILTEKWIAQFSLTDTTGIKNEAYLEIIADYEGIGKNGEPTTISSKPCLRYHAANDEEESRLKGMGFKTAQADKTWYRCFAFTVIAYKAPDLKIEQQSLRKTLPVKIIGEYIDEKRLAPFRAILMPFAIAADVVITIPVITIMMITHPGRGKSW